MKKIDPPIIVEQTFDCSVKTLWNAITELNQMRQWFFKEIPDFKPVVGFSTVFDISNDSRTFPHTWSITKVVEFEKIVYNWHYKPAYPGDGYVTFEISPENDGSKIILTSIVTEDYDDSIPEFKRESCQGGWTYFINQQLKSYIENLISL